MRKNILMVGTFDSKGKEFNYLYDEIKRRKVNIITMDVGIFEPTCSFEIQIPSTLVAKKGGEELKDLREKSDRGNAMKIMCQGARLLAKELQIKGKIQGIIGMGGGGGTSIVTTAMRDLPIGFPKICITTLASGNTREYVGTKDIVLYPSIVDICGINCFSKIIISRGAGAICGMVEFDPIPDINDKPIIAISMFGNSTPCVEKCVVLLKKAGFAPLVFHSTGIGGRTMEDFIISGHCIACLDITTTEWADELCGGILSAGTKRLEGPAIAKIPHVIAPGCLDMVNFGSKKTVPQHYINEKRKFYEWNPMVTLMRTNKEENCELGKILAKKANMSSSPVGFILPKRGLSILDNKGQSFCDWETNEILFDEIKKNIKPSTVVEEIDANINDDLFAKEAVNLLFRLMNKKNKF